jgi:hypothetical protein
MRLKKSAAANLGKSRLPFSVKPVFQPLTRIRQLPKAVIVRIADIRSQFGK